MSNVPARKGRALPVGRDDPASRRSFRYALSIEPPDVVESFKTDPRVRWSADGWPDAFPSAADPQFQAWQDAAGNVLLRETVPAQLQSVSPLVCIRIQARREGGTLVEGQFLRRPPSMSLNRVAKGLVLGIGGLYIVYGLVVSLVLGMFQPGLFAAIPIMALLLLQNNKPTKTSMQTHAAALWSLLGEKIVPHALSGQDPENPFRDRALRGD